MVLNEWLRVVETTKGEGLDVDSGMARRTGETDEARGGADEGLREGVGGADDSDAAQQRQ